MSQLVIHDEPLQVYVGARSGAPYYSAPEGAATFKVLSTMAITVKFFASLRERVGKAEAQLTPASGLSLQEIWQQTSPVPMPDNTLCAVNMEYVERNHLAQDGDEVAFFPPVTGG